MDKGDYEAIDLSLAITIYSSEWQTSPVGSIAITLESGDRQATKGEDAILGVVAARIAPREDMNEAPESIHLMKSKT